MVLTDIETKDDLTFLMQTFYHTLLKGPIAHFFEDLDMNAHLPLIVQFWEGIVFGQTTYRGNVMDKHFQLHARSPLGKQDFAIWLKVFEHTVDQHFAGEKAFLIKTRAKSIQQLMEYKILGGSGAVDGRIY